MYATKWHVIVMNHNTWPKHVELKANLEFFKHFLSNCKQVLFGIAVLRASKVVFTKMKIKIRFDTAGVLTTAFNEIDYEAFTNPSTYTMTIALGDTKSDITETIDITFTNQNEAPRFLKDYFTITVAEGDVSSLY